MTWLRVLEFTPEVKPPPKPRQQNRKPRPIKIRGIEYPSITAARKATGFSVMRIYYLIGEKHRNWSAAKQQGK
jgi:hypothetical protein